MTRAIYTVVAPADTCQNRCLAVQMLPYGRYMYAFQIRTTGQSMKSLFSVHYERNQRVHRYVSVLYQFRSHSAEYGKVSLS